VSVDGETDWLADALRTGKVYGAVSWQIGPIRMKIDALQAAAREWLESKKR
jgi:hypothetical protein